MAWPGSPFDSRPLGPPRPHVQVGEEHLAPRKILDELLPSSDGPKRAPAPSWAVEAAAPRAAELHTQPPPKFLERYAHRLLFASWLFQHTRLWRDDE